MRKAGIGLPDSVMVQSSTLVRKSEILEEMAANAKTDPLVEAKVELLKAQVTKTINEAVNSAVTAMFSATQAGNQIAAVPQIAPLADQLLKSAGFQDKDAPPIVPGSEGMAPNLAIAKGPGQPATHPAPVLPAANTSPNFPAKPASPATGVDAGIERMDARPGVPA